MKYNWDWGILFSAPYMDWLISGLGWTISVALAAWVIAFSVGSIVGVARTVPNRAIRAIGTAYVELFRNIPLLVQMFLWYFVLPEMVPDDVGRWLKREMPNPEYFSAVICLGLYTASRVAEQVRAGIEAISTGLSSAGYAAGLSTTQVYLHVLLPISYRQIVLPLTNEFLTIFKNSSLALTIGLLELTAQSQQVSEYTFQSFEAFTAATVIYVAVAAVVTLIMHKLEHLMYVPGFIGTGDK
ncbi:MAG: amino acid ABC transporter permease [Amphritea sp.]